MLEMVPCVSKVTTAGHVRCFFRGPEGIRCVRCLTGVRGASAVAFSQSTHLQTRGLHGAPLLKQAQYIFKHLLFLQWHPYWGGRRLVLLRASSRSLLPATLWHPTQRQCFPQSLPAAKHIQYFLIHPLLLHRHVVIELILGISNDV